MAKKQSNPRQEIINSAIQMGVGEIIRQHPRFRNSGHYIASHVDVGSLNQIFDGLYNQAQRDQVPQGKIGEYIMKGLASYIASGEVLDDAGKGRILNTSLENRAKSGFFKGRSARRELAGDKYLDQVINAWNEIGAVAKSGGNELPEEIARPMSYLNQLGFAIPAVEILEENGLIDRTQYSQIKNNIRKGAYESHTEALGNLEKYSMYHKVAAALLGIFGIGILFFMSGITGAAIGAPAKISSGIIGAVGVVVSCALFLMFSKKKF